MNNDIKTKENLYTVIKNADLDFLTETEQAIMKILLERISQLAPERKYYVVNTDEPYSHKILEAILDGEEAKGCGYQEAIRLAILSSVNKIHQDKIYTNDRYYQYCEHLHGSGETIFIPFGFTSYPLLGKFNEEMQSAVKEIVNKMVELKAKRWVLPPVERLRDISNFQDTYSGGVLIETEDEVVL